MVTSAQSFKIYQLLFKVTKSEEDAQTSVQEIENVIDYRFEKEMDRIATKEDLAKLEAKIETRMAEYKSDLIKWMFTFWVAQILAFVGLFLSLKK